MVETIRQLIEKVVALKRDADKKGERRPMERRPVQSSSPPLPPPLRNAPQAILISQAPGSSSSAPRTFNGVTTIGVRLPANGPNFVNRYLQGIHIHEE